MLKVALVSFWFSEYTIHLANALSAIAEVKLIVPARIYKKHLPSINKNINLCLFHYPRLRYPTNILMVFKVNKEIKRFHPDIVHLQAGHPWFNLSLPWLSKKYSIITTIHDVICHVGDTLSIRLPFKDYVLKYSKSFIVHGVYLKEQLISIVNLQNKKIFVIPHGELSLYRKFSKQNIAEEPNTILFFGRIWEYKGLRYLIEAEPIISEIIPDIKIIIAGEGEDFSKYERMMVNKDRFIVYNQFIEEEIVASFFQRSSLVVLPYIEASQSGVIPIAYSFKKPVVATNVGSIPEVVSDGVTGFMVPPKDSKQLADAIIRILIDNNLKKQMGENGYRMTLEELSWGNIASKTILAYQDTINKK